MNKEAEYDLYRCYGRKSETVKEKFLRGPQLKYIIQLRKTQNCNSRWLFKINKWKLSRLSRKSLIQIPPEVSIGRGFYIGHFGQIVINPGVVIGSNCNIMTGVTIGQENRGYRKGVPTIGSRVWIGTNAVIVGKIIIGDDVLIAPNAYVNFDVPSHSIVIGNPAKIVPTADAVQGYINNCV